jgi:hypothetical protein
MQLENTMNQLSRADLWSLEEYAEIRPGFRAEVMAHKKNRQLQLGVFEADGIAEELEAYNPLIPDGHNWKATFMIEYDDPQERALRLGEMVGIEDKVWLQVEGCERIYPIADEDLERDTADKTSSVHFLRFELDPGMIASVHSGAPVAAGVDHPAYSVEISAISPAIRDSLAGDLQAATIN